MSIDIDDLEFVIALKRKCVAQCKYELAHDLKHLEIELKEILNSQWTNEILTKVSEL